MNELIDLGFLAAKVAAIGNEKAKINDSFVLPAEPPDPIPATFGAVFVPGTCGPSVNQPFLRIAARF